MPIAGTDDSGLRRSESTADHSWLDEYLLGVAAEYDSEPETAATEALDHYENMLKSRPGSYWGTLSRGRDVLSSRPKR